MKPITVELACELNRQIVQRFGGEAGLRDKSLLEAALAQPYQTFDGKDLYPSIQEKASRLCFEVITQHPFIDGNKRMGATLLGVMLRGNGISFMPNHNELYQLIMGVARGAQDYQDILQFTNRNCS